MWIIFGHPHIIEITFNCLEKHQLRRSFSFSQCPWITSIVDTQPQYGVDYFWSPIHGPYWYYFLYQALRYDPLAFERDLKSEWVPNMMVEPMRFVEMLTSLPMKSWHVTSIFAPPLAGEDCAYSSLPLKYATWTYMVCAYLASRCVL